MPDGGLQLDVTVMGAGLAGMAASIHLAREGFHVVCVGPDVRSRQPVGESLDWSAPELLRALGLSMEKLIVDGIATYKRHVTLKLADGFTQHYVPSDWLGQSPFNVELRTLHVDRSLLNEAIYQIALNYGVEFLHERVASIDREDTRVAAIHTAEGTRISSPWFIDASGSGASLLPKTFNLPFDEYGPHKTAMWSYFKVSDAIEGTTLYTQERKSPYMEWIWEIPIHPDVISVGYVATGESIKAMRQQGLSVEEIFRTLLSRNPRFAALLETSNPAPPHVTSFRCRVHSKIAGPNWVVMGEAASMVDPMTSNGVTAALRHAVEGASLIIQSRKLRQIPALKRFLYSQRVESLARFFNSGIEKVLYDWPIRNRIGIGNAGDVYTVPAWSMNAIYARLRPRGVISTMLFGGALSVLRAVAAVLHVCCRQEEAVFETQA
jgi:2-polyprenyl-6-methoxyphenol hydroxylase-like FAD-dependent oxidoreductase